MGTMSFHVYLSKQDNIPSHHIFICPGTLYHYSFICRYLCP